MKAKGEGFRLVQSFSIDLNGPHLIHPEAGEWSLGELTLPASYVGAFALKSSSLPHLQMFDFSDFK